MSLGENLELLLDEIVGECKGLIVLHLDKLAIVHDMVFVVVEDLADQDFGQKIILKFQEMLDIDSFSSALIL